MNERNAIHALIDEHERALTYLLRKMSRWTDETLLVPLNGIEGNNLHDLLAHVVSCIFDPYFGWMQERLEFEGVVPPSYSRQELAKNKSIENWKLIVSECLPYCRKAVAQMKDEHLERAFIAPWNEGETYMIEQMFEHAIVHIWRHCRQLERLGL